MSPSSQEERRTGPRLPVLARLYEVFVAFRILRSRRRAFLSVVSLISAVGIVLGVTALTVIMSVSGGFQEAIRDKILGFYPHLVVLKRAGNFEDYRDVAERLRGLPEVAGVSPATYDEMMIANGDFRAGAVVKGVDVATADQVVDFGRFLQDGATLAALDERPVVSRRGPDTLVLETLTAGIAATVVVFPDGRPVALTDDTTPADPGRARVRFLHGLTGAEALRLTLDGPTPEDTEPADFGGATRYAEPAVGYRTFTLRPGDGGEPLVEQRVELEGGRRYTLVATHGAGGEVELRVVADDYVAPQPENAQVRLLRLDGGASPLRLVAQDGGAPIVADLPPGGVSDYVEVNAQLPGVLLAAGLAEQLHASKGDTVTVVSPLRGIGNKMAGPYGMAPTAARFRVVGRFQVGYYEYDTRFVLVAFPAAQRFLNRGDVPRWLEVRVDDFLLVKERARAVKAAVDPYDIGVLLDHVADAALRVREVMDGSVPGFQPRTPDNALDVMWNIGQAVGVLKFQDLGLGHRERFKLINWEEMNRYLFTTLKLQKVVLSVFFLIIILVASFNIVGSQVLVVHEKVTAIAILRSMGASRRGIRRIFLLQGMVVGALGTTLGLGLGWLLCAQLDKIGFQLDPKIYLISELPVSINPWEFMLTAAAALVFTFLASRYSAGKAAQRTPVEGLRLID